MEYKIRVNEMPLMNAMFSFRIVSHNEELGWNDKGYWVFNTLTEAKEYALKYINEQYWDYVNGPDAKNDIIKPKERIRYQRLWDLTDEFWEDYDLDQKRLIYLTEKMSMSLDELDKLVTKEDK